MANTSSGTTNQATEYYTQRDKKMSDKHNSISKLQTPKCYVEKKQNKFDYVDEGYMRMVLNLYYPIWSFQVIKYEILSNCIMVHGRLGISDHGQDRVFETLAAHRIAESKQGGGFVDLGNDLKSAVTDCFKVCVNRLCNVADDVYRKQVLTFEQINKLEKTLSDVNDSLKNTVLNNVRKKEINQINYEKCISEIKKRKKEK